MNVVTHDQVAQMVAKLRAESEDFRTLHAYVKGEVKHFKIMKDITRFLPQASFHKMEVRLSQHAVECVDAFDDMISILNDCLEDVYGEDFTYETFGLDASTIAESLF